MVLDEQMVVVKRYLQEHFILLSDYWLESCIKWYREQGESFNVKDLNLKVYEQWLLLDLREVDVPSLPSGLAEQKKLILNGVFSLQLLYVIDISESKFTQLQKIRNPNNVLNHLSEEPYKNMPRRRMLQLTLTDGVQEIKAIECNVIPQLHINLAPGNKLRIIGPVTVRRGQIMLKTENIKLLDGEVEEILISNSAENILARALGLPESNIPAVVKEVMDDVNLDIRISNNTHVELVNVNSLPGNVLQVASQGIHDRFTDQDELRLSAELDVILENNFSNPERNCKTPVIFDGAELNDDSFNVHSTSVSKDTYIVKTVEDISSYVPSQSATVGGDSLRIKTLPKKITSIINIQHKRQTISNAKFYINAKFKQVLEKLTVCDNAWSLKILVFDETGELPVYVHSDVISDLLGYLPSAVMSLRNGVINKDNTATTVIMKAIEGFKEKIQVLECVMEIQFKMHEEYPLISNLKI